MRPSFRVSLAAAVGAGLLAAAALGGMLAIRGGQVEKFSTGLAERRCAELEDGSRVELNAETVVSVRLARAERRVTLTSGEALFTVAKDEKRPFFVETGAGWVRATGTIFNVRTVSAGEGVEVTVLEGGVQVRARREASVAGREAMLAAGTQARIDGAHRLTVHALPEGAAQDAAAWRQGQVVFHDTPVREALERFAAYHPKTIVVEPEAAELRLGGRFALDDVNGLLDALERVLPVRIVREAGGGVRIKTSLPGAR